MPVDPKKLVKNIVRRVHPDLFGSRPAERTINSESLKAWAKDVVSAYFLIIFILRSPVFWRRSLFLLVAALTGLPARQGFDASLAGE